MENWMIYLLGFVALVNLFASAVVVRSRTLSGAQRWVQVALVWLLPVLGAVIVLAVAAANRSPESGLSESGVGEGTTLAHGPGLCDSGAGGGDD